MSKLWQESHTSPPKLITAWLLKSFSWLFTRISSTIPRLSASIKCILHQCLCVLLLTDWLSNLLDLLSNFWWLEFGAGRLALVVVVSEWVRNPHPIVLMLCTYSVCLKTMIAKYWELSQNFWLKALYSFQDCKLWGLAFQTITSFHHYMYMYLFGRLIYHFSSAETSLRICSR